MSAKSLPYERRIIADADNDIQSAMATNSPSECHSLLQTRYQNTYGETREAFVQQLMFQLSLTCVRRNERGAACSQAENSPALRKKMAAAIRRNARDLHYKSVVPSRVLTDEEWLRHPPEVSEVFRAIGMGTVDDPVQWLCTLKAVMDYAELVFAARVARNPSTGIEP